MNESAIKDLLFRVADDKLIIGHRNSEWIGLGPILEEDIAFASMAQDEVGHAQAYYSLLTELGEAIPDILAFQRKPEAFLCCRLVEMPIGDYAFSLVRHYLFEMADKIRLESLIQSSYEPLAKIAGRILREERYHQLHAETFLRQLATSTEESNDRIQAALNVVYPVAFSMFEPTEYTQSLADEGIQETEDALMKKWQKEVEAFFTNCRLSIPDTSNFFEHFGGRTGKHSPDLVSLLSEMTEVVQIDPNARW
jgi:ring-1,2-phenylacetyl-CoA epoxidase subunit PaaC